MLVYGDASERERAEDKLARVISMWMGADALAPGLARHAARIDALIEAGELAQGLGDRAFERAGRDGADPATEAAIALTHAIAKRCATSWRRGFADDAELATVDGVAAAIARARACLPAADVAIDIRQPEGYAFYLLYPESYLEAALSLPRQRWQVIGVRSIGTSLACMVAAGLDAPQPITVRPHGSPFAREIAADTYLIDRHAAAYALVDEGPGLSGSSLAAVAKWLRDAGVADARMHVFASHDRGPGAHATVETRAWWSRAGDDGRVHIRTFDALVLESSCLAHRLDRWVADVVGPMAAPLLEIGGGVWRELQARSDDDLPPVHPWQERRKFLAVGADASAWLVKFNGLGARAGRKLAHGRMLADAGLTPTPVGACHGFLIERWLGRSPRSSISAVDDAASASALPLHLEPEARIALLDRIAEYLAFRARHFAAPSASGASVEALFAMARQNTEQALGAWAASAWQRWAAALPALEKCVRRIETDNRLHRWEWLARADGVIVKTDAIDHHAGHDLVGCQDVAWDVAGATIEFKLDDGEEQRLIAAVTAAAGIEVSYALVVFCRGCYAAFQLAYYDEAARSAEESGEAPRLRAARDRYADRLRALLADAAFTPTR